MYGSLIDYLQHTELGQSLVTSCALELRIFADSADQWGFSGADSGSSDSWCGCHAGGSGAVHHLQAPQVLQQARILQVQPSCYRQSQRVRPDCPTHHTAGCHRFFVLCFSLSGASLAPYRTAAWILACSLLGPGTSSPGKAQHHCCDKSMPETQPTIDAPSPMMDTLPGVDRQGFISGC